MDVEVDIDISDVRNKYKDAYGQLTADIRQGLSRTLAAGKAAAQSLAPRDTGALIRGIQSHITRDGAGWAEGELVSTAPYSSFVTDGTRPHTIRAKGRALRFEWNGDWVSFPQVRHPGTQPDPFMAHAEDVIRIVLQKEMEFAAANFARNLNR